MPLSSPRQKGSLAEQQALDFLKQHGLKLITKNYHTRMGEIDLIMQDAQFIVFVEVRYREQVSHGNGAETVDSNKRKKIIKTATYYLQQHNLYDKVPCRFDVISIDKRINWIKGAFYTE